MIVVRKGKSSKSYENEFFRKISKELSRVFEQRRWDGILLGMPECITREDLQIDCLLVTENQIIIIDFKDYSGILELPSEENFKFGRWIMNGDVNVKGGSSPNPFSQLAKQRIKLVDELKYRLDNFERKSISTIVLFQDKIEIIGEIPREFQVGFSIVDSTNYLNKIVDIIDVIVNKNINYLSEKNRKIFTEILFATDEYLFDNHVEFELNKPIVETRSKHIDTLQQIREFLVSDCKIMTLTGNTGSGKTELIPYIRELAFDVGFTEVPVFAYSNRLRKKMLKNNPGLEDVESLFKTIFDFSNETIDEFYQKIIPLKKHDKIYHETKTLFIIDDSHLITNSNLDSDLLRFGSGYLLSDILNYINLESNPERKIIFIGDKNKLSFGSATENALNTEYLKSLLENRNIYSEVMNIELPDYDGDSEIIKVCNNIAKNIKNNQYNELFIHSRKEITLCNKNDWENVVSEAYLNQNSKILVFTNEQANKANSWIKRKIIKNGSELAEKDYLVFHSTIEALISMENKNDISSFSELKRVDNGYFGEVISVNYNRIIIKTVDVNEDRVILRFIPCQIRLQDGSIIETLVFDNYLKSTKNELEKKEIIALQIILSSYEKVILKKEPFEKSIEYQAMLQHPDQYIAIEKDGKIEYRDSKDKRKLTYFEQAYRKRKLKKLKDPTSEYFKILNSAKVKYGWAMTVHRAMAYSFDTVIFNTYQEENRGRTNKDYFKWLYTGISIGLNNVKLINWKTISPFLKTEFKKTSNVNIPKNKNVIFALSNKEKTAAEQLRHYLETKLIGVATIINIASRPYLEIVTLEMNNRKIELFFDYNGKDKMKLPRLKSGTEEDYETILQLLKSTFENLPAGIIQAFIEKFSSLLETHDIQIKLLHYHNWNLIFNFTRQEKSVDIQLWYNGDGMITQFNYIRGNREFFYEIVNLIKEIYALD